MAKGSGIYEDETKELRLRLEADGLLLFVFGGNRGSGIACQVSNRLMAMDGIKLIAATLRQVADEMEADWTKASAKEQPL